MARNDSDQVIFQIRIELQTRLLDTAFLFSQELEAYGALEDSVIFDKVSSLGIFAEDLSFLHAASTTDIPSQISADYRFGQVSVDWINMEAAATNTNSVDDIQYFSGHTVRFSPTRISTTCPSRNCTMEW